MNWHYCHKMNPKEFSSMLKKCGVLDYGNVGVAVSGSVESMALLVLSKAALGDRVHAITVEDGSEQSKLNSNKVSEVAIQLGIQHTITEGIVQVRSKKKQELIRHKRYEQINKVARVNSISHVLLGNSLNDQVQDVFQRMGQHTLHGFLSSKTKFQTPYINNIEDPSIFYGRPLLSIPSKRLEQVCRDKQVEWAVDLNPRKLLIENILSTKTGNDIMLFLKHLKTYNQVIEKKVQDTINKFVFFDPKSGSAFIQFQRCPPWFKNKYLAKEVLREVANWVNPTANIDPNELYEAFLSRKTKIISNTVIHSPRLENGVDFIPLLRGTPLGGQRKIFELEYFAPFLFDHRFLITVFPSTFKSKKITDFYQDVKKPMEGPLHVRFFKVEDLLFLSKIFKRRSRNDLLINYRRSYFHFKQAMPPRGREGIPVITMNGELICIPSLDINLAPDVFQFTFERIKKPF